MTPLELLLLLVIAGVCGSLGQALAGKRRGGLLLTVVLGYVGALLGAWIARTLSLPEPLIVDIGGAPFPILWSIIGSALFVALLSMLTRGSKN